MATQYHHKFSRWGFVLSLLLDNFCPTAEKWHSFVIFGKLIYTSYTLNSGQFCGPLKEGNLIIMQSSSPFFLRFLSKLLLRRLNKTQSYGIGLFLFVRGLS